MINIGKYRSTSEYREILRILQKSTTTQDNILWQAHTLAKTIIPVQYIEIDFIQREVLVNFSSEHHRIDPEIPLYVKLGYRTSVFKITDFRQNQDSIYFSFPEIVKTEELRSVPRHVFRPAQEKYVTINSTTGMNELKVRIMDVSEQGLGLVVSDMNRNFLKNNRILWVNSLQDLKFADPMIAEIMYVNTEVDPKYVIKKQKSLKVGLRLSEKIPAAIYNQFLL